MAGNGIAAEILRRARRRSQQSALDANRVRVAAAVRDDLCGRREVQRTGREQSGGRERVTMGTPAVTKNSSAQKSPALLWLTTVVWLLALVLMGGHMMRILLGAESVPQALVLSMLLSLLTI